MARASLFLSHVIAIVRPSGEAHEVLEYEVERAPRIDVFSAERRDTFRSLLAKIGIPHGDIAELLQNAEPLIGPVPDHADIVVSTSNDENGLLLVFVNQPNGRFLQFELHYARGKKKLRKLMAEI